jgi:hypothetical protein
MNETLKTTRIIACAIVSGSIAFWIIVYFISQEGGPEIMVTIAVLAGLVAPVAGYRIYRRIWERRPDGEQEASAAFLRANIIALAIAEGASLFGAVTYLLTGNPLTCTGLITQVLLTGAIWPNEQRMRSFLETGP